MNAKTLETAAAYIANLTAKMEEAYEAGQKSWGDAIHARLIAYKAQFANSGVFFV